jgi:hypothetical protein
MLQSYFPLYEIALDLQNLRSQAKIFREGRLGSQTVTDLAHEHFEALLKAIHDRCLERELIHTAAIAGGLIRKPPPENYGDLYHQLDYLDDSLSNELKREAVFRVAPERKKYYEPPALFGKDVADAFPSCERDIQKAGSCYALGQEDACVHHLMLVLERGLNALATKVGVSFHYADWQKLIGLIEIKLKSGVIPRGPELDFYRHVTAQFGFLKEAYRNHSAHARDDPYDMDKALSILNHVREFMQELAKGGLKE